MKVSGYVTAIEPWQTSTGKPKVSIVLDGLETKYPFWVHQRGKPDFLAPKVGDFIDIEYTDDGKYINGVEWALQRQEPIKKLPPAQGEQPADKWATLSPKDQIMARMNATNNATALVVALLAQKELWKPKDHTEIADLLETNFQFCLNLLYGQGKLLGAKTELDVAMEAALAWGDANGITPAVLDKFVGAYRVSHNLTTLEVLTLINQGRIDASTVEVAGE